MTAKMLFTITAALALIFGLGFLLLPDFTIGIFGADLNDGGEVAARLYGKALLAIGTVNWLGRNLEGEGARALAGGDLVNFAVAALVTGWSFMTGVANALALMNVVAFVVLAVAFALLLFSGRRDVDRRGQLGHVARP